MPVKIGADGKVVTPVATAGAARPVDTSSSWVKLLRTKLPAVMGLTPMKGLPPMALDQFTQNLKWTGSSIPTNMGETLRSLAELLIAHNRVPINVTSADVLKKASAEDISHFREWLTEAIESYEEALDTGVDLSTFQNKEVQTNLEQLQKVLQPTKADPAAQAKLAQIRHALGSPAGPDLSPAVTEDLPPEESGEEASPLVKELMEDSPSGQAGQRPAAEMFQSAEPAVEPVCSGSGSLAAMAVRHCPRCQHDLSLSVPTEVSEEDKDDYILAMQAPRPFEKSYPFLRGKMAVRFRGLFLEEMDWVVKQLGVDERLGRFGDDPVMRPIERRVWAARYQLALQVLEISTEQGLTWQGASKPQEWAEMIDTPPNETFLRPLLSHLTQQVLPSQSLYEMVRIRLGEFNALVNRLEGLALSPDF